MQNLVKIGKELRLFDSRSVHRHTHRYQSGYIVYTMHCTVCLKIHLAYDHNFSECRTICKILSLAYSHGNSLFKYYRAYREFLLTIIVLLHYLAKIKNLKRPNVYSYHQN